MSPSQTTHRLHRPHALVRASVSGAVVMLLAAYALMLPAGASAAYLWSEGGTKKFGGSVSSNLVKVKSGTRYSVRLKQATVSKTAAPNEVASAQRLENGRTLVAYRGGPVVELTQTGTEYPVLTGLGGNNPTPLSAAFAARVNRSLILVIDSTTKMVFVYDTVKNENQWGYSTNLVDPVYAVRLSDGSVLICDAGGSKVVRVRSDKTEKWTIDSGVVGSPRSVQDVGNGNVLIADKGKHRVIEVKPGTDEIVWSFGKVGVAGSGTNHLNGPTFAQRQSDGSTIIVDSGNNRILHVSKSGSVQTIKASTLGLDSMSPSTASITPDGNVLLVDAANSRLVEYGYAKSGRYTSDKLDFGSSAKKRITRIEAVSARPADTTVKIHYSIDGKKWKSVNGASVTLPGGVNATYVRVRVDLSTSDRSVTPILEALQVTYDAIPTVGSAGPSNWSQLYGQTFAPYNPNSTSAGVAGGAKAAGAAGALPQGTAVPGVASATVYSGFLMKRVTNGAQVTKDPRGLMGLPIDPAGTTAALLFMTAVYSVGLASTTLSRVAQTALQSLKSVILRSMNG